jgi:hypothetical protein
MKSWRCSRGVSRDGVRLQRVAAWALVLLGGCTSWLCSTRSQMQSTRLAAQTQSAAPHIVAAVEPALLSAPAPLRRPPSRASAQGHASVPSDPAHPAPHLDAPPRPDAPHQSRRYALLVGCTTYPNLPQRRQLQGPAHDVQRMRELLVSHFGFAEADIRILADSQPVDDWPTAAAIRREFARLVERAAPGDDIFILLAGHGSQQPDTDGDEPDGFDETFLPRDVGTWNGQAGVVENALSDDDIRAALAQMVQRGAFVFVVADTCHSGTITRGDDEAQQGDDPLLRSRLVPAEELGVPPLPHEPTRGTAPARDPKAAAPPASPADWLRAARTAGQHSGLVALYACQPRQATYEEPIPPGGPRVGRLTYALAEALQQSPRPITYRELAQRIVWRYSGNGWIHRSTPGIEGTHLDRAVLGAAAQMWPGRSQFRLEQAPGQLEVTAGALHGLGPGSVLAVYPPAGSSDADRLLGYVQVTAAGPVRAVVEPIAYRERPPLRDPPQQARCELVYRDVGELVLTVAVASEGFATPEQADQSRLHARALVQQVLAQGDSIVRLTEPQAAPQWFAITTPGGLYLQRSGSRHALDDAYARRSGEIHGPFDLADRTSALVLGDHLQRIARASNLVALAEAAPTARNPRVDIELSVTRDGEPFAPARPADAQVQHGQRLRLHIRNTGTEAVSVAVFYADNSYQVAPFFPLVDDDFLAANNRIEPDGTLYRTIGFRINDRTVGWEHVVVIAVAATDELAIHDLVRLQQEGLTQRTRAPDAPPLRSPLGRLIELSIGGGTRAGRQSAAPPIGTYAIRRVSWNVVAQREGSPTSTAP